MQGIFFRFIEELADEGGDGIFATTGDTTRTKRFTILNANFGTTLDGGVLTQRPLVTLLVVAELVCRIPGGITIGPLTANKGLGLALQGAITQTTPGVELTEQDFV